MGMGLTTSKISNLPGQKSEGGGGDYTAFDTSTTKRNTEFDACEDENNGQFFTTEFPPQPVTPAVGSFVYTNAAGTAFPEPGYYSQYLDQYAMKVWYELGANGECTDAGMCT
jgi:hypothetical protein